MIEQDVFLELIWSFYSNIVIGHDHLTTKVYDLIIPLTTQSINQVLGMIEEGLTSKDLTQMSKQAPIDI